MIASITLYEINRLGHGDEHTQPEPRIICKLLGIRVRMISAGENHTLATTDKGDIFSWGSNRFGQLGVGGLGSGETGGGSLLPQKLENFKKSVVIAIAAGDSHSVCFTDNGELFAWGSNKEGQLGIPHSEVVVGLGGNSGVFVPRRVYLRGKTGGKSNGDGKGKKFGSFRSSNCPYLQIAASQYSTLLLTRPHEYDKGIGGTGVNEVYQWGHGSAYPSKVQFSKKLNTIVPGKNGGNNEKREKYRNNGKYDEDCFFGKRSPSMVDIVQLSAGLHHNVALSSCGHVYIW
jgi:alpha-tubulin suppressor-like RCC1 family protein